MDYFKISRFFLYLVPLGIVLVTRSTLFPFIVGKYVWFRSLIGLALVFFLLGLLFNREADFYWKRLKKVVQSPLFIAVSVFIAAFLLATFFGIDPAFSFWSNFERGEGGLQILNLYVFFVLLFALFRNESDWRKLFWVFLLSALLMVLYGIGASLKYVDAEIIEKHLPDKGTEYILSGRGGPLYQTFKSFIGPSFSASGYRFQGSIGNPAYVATYLIFSLFFAGYLLFSKLKLLGKGQKFTLIIGILIFGAFFLLAATRGSFVGLGVGVFVGFLYLAFKSKIWRKYILGALALLIILSSSLIYFRESPFVKSIPGSRIFDISFSAETFQHRTIMWGIAWEGFKERPIFGWGPESYLLVFSKHYNPDYFTPGKGYGAWFDRAHSVIFDYLAATGIIGLLSYIGIFIVFFWQLVKKRTSALISKNQHESASIGGEWAPTLKALMIALPVAYLVQGLVLFDVSATYIPLFAFLSFAAYKFQERTSASISKNQHESVSKKSA